MGERTDERRVAQGGAKDSAWDDFERQLADYLATMVDEDDQDHLILELAVPEPDDGCAPYAQLSAFGGGELLGPRSRATTTWETISRSPRTGRASSGGAAGTVGPRRSRTSS